MTTSAFYVIEASIRKGFSDPVGPADDGFLVQPNLALSQVEAGAATDDIIYASDAGYRTRASDPKGVIAYRPSIIEAFSVDVSANLDPTQSAVAAAWGDLTLNNMDHAYDEIMRDWASDGQRITIFRGEKTLEEASANSGRTTPATLMDATGRLQIAPPFTVRSADYTNSLTVDPLVTNLLTASASPGIGGLWGNRGNPALTGGQAGPDGSSNAVLMVPGTVSALYDVYQFFAVTTGVAYTATWHIKPAGYTWIQVQNWDFGANGGGNGGFVNLVGAGVVGALYNAGTATGTAITVTALPNGWYRVALSGVPSNGAISPYIQAGLRNSFANNDNGGAGNGVSGYLLANAMAQTGMVATPYFATTALPVTKGRGATNYIRNSTMVGAVVGTPGVLPNFWGQSQNTGIDPQVTGFGVESGIPYVDVRFVGTTVGGNNNNLWFEVNIPARRNQQWTGSVYLRVVAGSWTNIASAGFLIGDNTANLQGGSFLNATSDPLETRRYASPVTTGTGAVTNITLWGVQLVPVIGAAIDITLRIGGPQLEAGSAATAFIPTSGSLASRAPTYSVTASPAILNEAASTNYVTTGLVPAGPNATVATSTDVPALLAGTPVFRHTCTVSGGDSSLGAMAPTGLPLYPPTDATLDLQFVKGVIDPRIIFTRESKATSFGPSGTLQEAAANQARFDYNPITLLPLGLLMEEGRTNVIRNPRAEGAIPSAPGTPPINWGQDAGITGLTCSIVGVGTESGIGYVDMRWSGTSTATDFIRAHFELGQNAPAAQGQQWAFSTYIRLMAGSFAGVINGGLLFQELNAAFGNVAFTTALAFTGAPAVTGAPLAGQRISGVATTTNAATAFIADASLQFTIAGATAVDMTLRIGFPQLELGGFVTSVILPPVGARTISTRLAEIATMPVSGLVNLAATTLHVEATALKSSAVKTTVSNWAALDDGTNGNVLAIRLALGTANAVTTIASGGITSQSNIKPDGGGGHPRPDLRYAIAADASGGISANNGSVSEGYSVVMPASITELQIGSQIIGGGPVNGYIRRIRVWTRKLSTTEMNQETIALPNEPSLIALRASFYLWIPSTFPNKALTMGIEGGTNTVTIGTADLTKRDQWQRVSCTAAMKNGIGFTSILLLDATPVAGDVVYTTGWQIEIDSGATSSLIPTASTPAVRAADLNYPGRQTFIDPPYASLVQVFTGVMGPWRPEPNLVKIALRDASYYLELPLPRTSYGGAGELDGTDGVKGVSKPITFGGSAAPNSIQNISPLLIDPANLVYQFNDGTGIVYAAYDGGAALTNAGAVTDLYLGDTPPASFRYDSARGCLQLGSTPVFELTADVGSIVSGSLTTTVAKLVVDAMLSPSLLAVPPGFIGLNPDGITIAAYAANLPSATTAINTRVGLYVASGDDIDGVTFINRLIAATGALLVPGRDGELRIMALTTIPGGATPVVTFDDSTIVTITPQALPAVINPPPKRLRLAYDRNWTIQTSNLAGITTPDQLAFISAGSRVATGLGVPLTLSRFARQTDPPVIGDQGGSLEQDSAVVQPIVDDMIALWGIERKLYEIVTPQSVGLALDWASIVRVVSDFDGLDGGKLGQIVGWRYSNEDATAMFRVLV